VLAEKERALYNYKYFQPGKVIKQGISWLMMEKYWAKWTQEGGRMWEQPISRFRSRK
jgi:hypothetical protein